MSLTSKLPRPKIVVTPLRDEDWASIGEGFYLAFKDEPVLNQVWPPERQPPLARQVENYVFEREQSVLYPSIADSAVVEMVARLEETGQVVGHSIWHKPTDRSTTNGRLSDEEKAAIKLEDQAREARKGEREKEIDAGMEGVFWKEFKGEMRRVREKIFGPNQFWYLEFLYVHPSYQGLGIGQALLRWGFEQADRDGVPVYLESTEVGRPVYERVGFAFSGEWIEAVSPKGVALKVPGMIRPPSSSSAQ